MNILAIDTSSQAAGAAVVTEHKTVAEIIINERKEHSRTIMPIIDGVLKGAGITINDINYIACTNGPGSFTGLRVGVATAKMFAYATGAKVIGVDTLLALAAAAGSGTERISVAVDAQRGEVVAQNFKLGGDLPVPLGPQRLIPIDQWWNFGKESEDHESGDHVVFSGPILHRIEKNVPAGIILEDRTCWNPQAAQIGKIATKRFEQGKFDDLWTLLPQYSRPSAAEERIMNDEL